MLIAQLLTQIKKQPDDVHLTTGVRTLLLLGVVTLAMWAVRAVGG
jgi:hypothetical protein